MIVQNIAELKHELDQLLEIPPTYEIHLIIRLKPKRTTPEINRGDISNYLKECAESREGVLCPTSLLYLGYLLWCKKNAYAPHGSKTFSQYLVEIGHPLKSGRIEGKMARCACNIRPTAEYMDIINQSTPQ